MLIEFSVANYRSFKERATLSMVAANLSSLDKDLDNNCVFAGPGDLRLLTSTVIYGANASGKSNLLSALSLMRRLVLTSSRETQIADRIDVEPFQLAPETAGEPTLFEAVFILDGTRYRYGFEVTPREVVSEWLYYVPSIKEARLFEREGQKIVVGRAFREGRGLVSRTRENALFLSVVAQFNGRTAESILRWFGSIKGGDAYPARILSDFMPAIFERDISVGECREEVFQLIKLLDLGIEEISLKHTPFNEETIPQFVPDELRRIFIEHSPKEVVKVGTIHHSYDADGKQVGAVAFDLEQQESTGTRKLTMMAPAIVCSLKRGHLVVADELDSSLHPTMLRHIIGLFNNSETNPNHAQLIFSTQDTSILNNRTFRRDQIWFTEKNRYGATSLYSLAEFKVRNDASYSKDYIRGKYGAVPFIGDLTQVLGKEDET